MSIFAALFDNRIYNFQQAFGVQDITSTPMQNAIRDWYGLYYADGMQGGEDPAQRLPVTVVSKLTRAMFGEYEATATRSGDAFCDRSIEELDRVRLRAMQHCLIGGEAFLKPIVTARGITFGVIPRTSFLVLARNERGEITDVGTAERTNGDRDYWTLLERRTVDEAGYLTIRSRLFHSTTEQHLGQEVPLQSLEKYAGLQPLVTLPEPVGNLGLAPLRMSTENCVDGSADGVSVYAPAVGLIHSINRNEYQLNTEFENGESRIIVSADMLKTDSRGRRYLGDHVFVGVDEDPERAGITIFSPQLRETSFIGRKKEYLRNVESMIGLKRGLLSDVDTQEKTATEITSSAGEYNLTIIDLQRIWEGAAREALRLAGVFGTMYRVPDAHAIDPGSDVAFDWGNGVLYDADKTWQEQMSMVAAGLLKPELALAWKYGEPCETDADLAAVRKKYMPETGTEPDEEDESEPDAPPRG